LTELVSKLILSKVQADPALAFEIKRHNPTGETGYLGIAQNREAHARLANALDAQQQQVSNFRVMVPGDSSWRISPLSEARETVCRFKFSLPKTIGS
jgi:hypothetical protein